MPGSCRNLLPPRREVEDDLNICWEGYLDWESHSGRSGIAEAAIGQIAKAIVTPSKKGTICNNEGRISYGRLAEWNKRMWAEEIRAEHRKAYRGRSNTIVGNRINGVISN